MGKAPPVADLGGQRQRPQLADAPVGGQANYGVGKGRLGGGLREVGLDIGDLGVAAGCHRSVVAEDGLQLVIVEALGAQPALVLAGPAGPGAIDATMPQEKGLQPPQGAAAVTCPGRPGRGTDPGPPPREGWGCGWRPARRRGAAGPGAGSRAGRSRALSPAARGMSEGAITWQA